MAIEVLLMQDIENLGAEGEVVKVSEGYARNYLLPRDMAAPVTEGTRRRLAKIQREREEANQRELEGAQELANRLQAISCTISVKTGEDDKMYGSVTSQDIADVLKEQGIEIDRHKLQLDEPIKELGV